MLLFLSQCKSSVSLQLQFPVFTRYIHVYIYKISQSLLILSHLALKLECIAIKPPWIAAMVYYQIWILFSFCTLDYLFLCYQICRIYSHLISLTLLQTPLPQPPLKKKIKNHWGLFQNFFQQFSSSDLLSLCQIIVMVFCCCFCSLYVWVCLLDRRRKMRVLSFCKNLKWSL